jgi:hypothetical protein
VLILFRNYRFHAVSAKSRRGQFTLKILGLEYSYQLGTYYKEFIIHPVPQFVILGFAQFQRNPVGRGFSLLKLKFIIFVTYTPSTIYILQDE